MLYLILVVLIVAGLIALVKEILEIKQILINDYSKYMVYLFKMLSTLP